LSEKNAESAELSQLEDTLAKKEHKLQTIYCRMGKSILEIADGEQRTIDALDKISAHLLEKENITGKEFMQLLQG
jgi:hypothetical protein